VIDKTSQSDQLMVIGFVMRKCNRVVHKTELQVTTQISRKLMEIATGDKER
jgi:hypothetical protein